MSKERKSNLLYHYTNQEGLMGILKSQELWATKIQYMNDSYEFDEPIKVSREILDEKLEEENTGKIDQQAKSFIEDLSFETDWWDVSDNICIVSFCTNGDLLSQWRGYGSFGSAYSVGFDKKKLMDSLKLLPVDLYPCNYFNTTTYKTTLDRFITGILEKSIENQGLPEIESLTNQFVKLASTMKLDCFREENEWRLVVSNLEDGDFKFRTSRSMIIPFYPIKFDISAISEIVVGPSYHQNLALRSVHLLTNKIFSNHRVTTRKSTIPYRVFL
ncbi:MAG: DUF2971 domain-containing protein [Dehalococcoidales bacterium]|nr:DUF2971 domain-containing protein [Dehalococcoidales bacterium]